MREWRTRAHRMVLSSAAANAAHSMGDAAQRSARHYQTRPQHDAVRMLGITVWAWLTGPAAAIKTGRRRAWLDAATCMEEPTQSCASFPSRVRGHEHAATRAQDACVARHLMASGYERLSKRLRSRQASGAGVRNRHVPPHTPVPPRRPHSPDDCSLRFVSRSKCSNAPVCGTARSSACLPRPASRSPAALHPAQTARLASAEVRVSCPPGHGLWSSRKLPTRRMQASRSSTCGMWLELGKTCQRASGINRA